MTKPSREEIIALARSEYHEDGVCEVADNAQISCGDESGCYVAAWVWVSFESERTVG